MNANVKIMSIYIDCETTQIKKKIVLFFGYIPRTLKSNYQKNLHRVLKIFSDGGGRSGVYLSIDANLELAEEEDCYDVFGYLKTLRQSRKGMVETLVMILSGKDTKIE